MAIVEDNLTTVVRRGENRGRTLQHTAVVRSLTRLRAIAAGERARSRSGSVPIPAESKTESVRAIAFLQVQNTRQIIGAAATR